MPIFENLERRQYRHPKIVGAVAQVLIEWTPEEFHEACKRLQEREGLKHIKTQTTHTVNFQLVPNAVPSASQEFAGVIAVCDAPHELIIERNGLRVVLRGDYPGREVLFNQMATLIKCVEAVNPSVVAKRVSILFSCNVKPIEDPYFIEEYITPRFELPDERLQMWDSFRHEVVLNLSRFDDAGDRKCRVKIGSDSKRGGIELQIDALDYAKTPLKDVMERLEYVKDLETHVFENLITDRTRELYGLH